MMTPMLDIADVNPQDLRLDYHSAENRITLELTHAQDYVEGTRGDHMDVHPALVINTLGGAHHAAAEDYAIAICATANASPALLATFKALALAARTTTA